MKYCCPGFQAQFQNTGARGFAVFYESGDLGGPLFVLQHRLFDLGRERIHDVAPSVTLVDQVGIQFCPWCGRRLEKWYRKDLERLKRPEAALTGCKLK